MTIDTNSANFQIYGATRFDTIFLTGSSAGLFVAPGYILRDKVYAGGLGNQFVAQDSSGSLTIASSGEIRLLAGSSGAFSLGGGNTTILTNDGLIANETTNRQFNIQPVNFINNNVTRTLGGDLRIAGNTASVNHGDIVADDPLNLTSPTLTFTSAWSNTGRIIADAATVNFGGTFTTAGMGLAGFFRTGGTVNITGTLNNTGDTLSLNASTGSWFLRNGEIRGGGLNMADGQTLRFTTSGGTLRDVTVNGDLSLEGAAVSTTIAGSTRFGTLTLTSSGASLFIAPGYVLKDRIYAAATGGQSIEVSPSGALTIDTTGEVRFLAGTLGNLAFGGSNLSSLTNNGLISCEATSRTLTIGPASFTNNGTVQALAGTISFQSNTAITNVSGSTLTGGTWRAVGTGVISGTPFGSIFTNAANVELGGAGVFAPIGSLRTNAGTFSLSGGKDLALAPGNGTLLNDGTIALGAGSTLSVTGAYTQGPGGKLDSSFNGTNPATNIGVLNASGVVTLAGTLKAQPVDNYLPAAFLDFTVVSGASRSGSFSATQFPAPESITYIATYSASSGRVSTQPGVGYWTGLGDGVHWNDAANWTGNILPGPADSVVIDVPGNATIIISSGSQSVRSVQSRESITLSGGSLTISSGASNIAGTLQVSSGTFTIGSSATLNVEGAMVVAAGLVVNGSLTLPSGGTIANSATFSGTGSIAVNGGTLNINSSASGSLAVTIALPATAALGADQSLRTLTNQGTLDLGTSTIALAGSLSLSTTGTLLAGIVSETQMGNIIAPGAVNAAGNLTVYAVNGFDPSRGNVLVGLPILRGAVRSGEFVDINLPSTQVGAYALRYRADRAEIIFNIADYNGDGGVDGADIDAFYSYWEAGSDFADINGDGGVDGSDVGAYFEIWESGGE